MQQWLELLTTQIRHTTFWEWFAVLLGVAEVLLARKNKVWLYPAGIASSAITIFLLLKVGLYADSALNAYYVLMSIYGWVLWVYRKGQPPIQVAYATRKEWMVTLLIAFGGWGLIYLLLKNYTPSTVPVWDAWVSSSAWAGTWLLARRRIENWLVLNISNLFAIPLLFHKELPLFALLTAFLFIVAIFGYLEWRKIYKSTQAAKQVI
ncbi:nicotinamide riboside transporter PnuC [Mucilaginibacter sp. Bleaf8]|uniref:nicotinamide riboside transporter PnuC n=1 Tax=Mucilaginibacter sp. Bleaf8 TaxID=2834430 RepID=UPI001BCAC642|nr:nicotinamide riboside transporter PnuC [Mucilaginibacter sp. Bleaf8]MBS7566654.1 nicotinamide riboside transporter PnuC [Mucilaginibacter sp. Bleaf8]